MEFSYPQDFMQFLEADSNGDLDDEGRDRFLRTYAGDLEDVVPSSRILHQLSSLEGEALITSFDIELDDSEAYPHLGFRRYLQHDLGENEMESPFLTETIFQEWAFLQEHSLIASRIRHTFEVMIDGRATRIQVGVRAFDWAVRKTLKKDEHHELSNVQRLRAVGKWGALGTTAAVTSGLIQNPPAGVVFTAKVASPFILLIDP